MKNKSALNLESEDMWNAHDYTLCE